MELDTIICADALTYLRTLPDGCVNCVVTSPPYFGLRDYGTATWDGGDPACDHKIPHGTTRGGPNSTLTGGQDLTAHTMQARDTCPKCGAILIDSQIGLEPTPGEYVAALVEVFREVRRVLRDDGVVWLNLGDSYASSPRGNTTVENFTRLGWTEEHAQRALTDYKVDKTKMGLPAKSLMGIPWRVAFGLQDDGWTLRADIIWAKPNPMPESVTDRPTRSHEYIFLLAKGPKYWYDAAAVSELVVRTLDATNGGNLSPKGEHKANGAYRERGGDYPLPRADGLRNRRTVWTITPANYADAHFATFPEAIPEICIKAGCPEGGVVLDPFSGAGTTALVAKKLNRRYLGCDLNADYVEMARARIDSIPYTLFSLMAAQMGD
jgi:DNA modification methylase